MTNDMMLFLLQQKLDFLGSVIEPLMIWYVSSVVFCGSIISAAYINRKDVASIHGLNWFCSLILFFFASIVTFGIWAIIALVGLQKDTMLLSTQLGLSQGGFSEFTAIYIGVAIGTSSFIFILITWIFLWKLLAGLKMTQSSDPNSPSTESTV